MTKKLVLNKLSGVAKWSNIFQLSARNLCYFFCCIRPCLQGRWFFGHSL